MEIIPMTILKDLKNVFVHDILLKGGFPVARSKYGWLVCPGLVHLFLLIKEGANSFQCGPLVCEIGIYSVTLN